MAAKRSDDDRYSYRIYDDPQRPGRKIIKIALGHGRYLSRRASPESAEEKAKELIAALRDDLNAKGASMTLQAFITVWWQSAIEQRDLAPKTRQDYGDTLSRYVLPRWGSYRLDEFDAPEMIKVFWSIHKEHGQSIAHRSLTKLHMVFDAARRWKYIKYNPVEDARKDLPAVKRQSKRTLTQDEERRLLQAVQGHRLEALYYTGLTLGLRPGELLGLQWSAIDWQARTLTVRSQSQEVGGATSFRETTKSEASRRVLPIPPRLLEQLRAMPKESLFVFSNEDGGMLRQSNLGRQFRGGQTGSQSRDGKRHRVIGIRAKANLPPDVTLHMMRHTCSSRMLELGVMEEIRSAILGHGKRTITQHYSHATMAAMRQAVEAVERKLYENREARADTL